MNADADAGFDARSDRIRPSAAAHRRHAGRHVREGAAMKAVAIGLAAAACAGALHAQTPAQMEYDRQQREYWRQQEQQRQEQQRQQQILQQNAQRQQDESARAMPSLLPQGTGGAPAGGGTARAPGFAGTGGAAGAQLEQARQTWLKRPALPADRNPLLGTWTRPQAASGDPFAQLGALMKGGVCEVFFSGEAVFEFRNDTLVGRDKRTHRAEVLDQVEYRGDAKRVVVIPKTTLKLIVFDFDGPDRIHWAGQNCTLSRVSARR
jgi:hypothetical protein